jgi:hypothetical protein
MLFTKGYRYEVIQQASYAVRFSCPAMLRYIHGSFYSGVERGVHWECSLSIGCQLRAPPILRSLSSFSALLFKLFILLIRQLSKLSSCRLDAATVSLHRASHAASERQVVIM